jgi:uncharacterized protein YfaS (alpha-2-macroglobulin family)
MKKSLYLPIEFELFLQDLCPGNRLVSLQIAAGYLPEKAYLHFDKSTYYPGETVWFKAYLMEDLFPAEKSRTLYVDWLNDDGDVLLHTVSPLVEGYTNGQFEIPLEVHSDLIHVRAYTKWMLNFEHGFFV